MNIRKPVDYSTLYVAISAAVDSALPQMKLYCEIGRQVSARQEKGAAVAAAEFLAGRYPDMAGFSPRNLRRMRDFYRMYVSEPEALSAAMKIGWTQNVVILEADLTLPERTWYIEAVRQYGWSKKELTEKIKARAHMAVPLDSKTAPCYHGAEESDAAGKRETSALLAQDPQPAEVQRVSQLSGTRGSHLKNLYQAFICRKGSAQTVSLHPQAGVFIRRRDTGPRWGPGGSQSGLSCHINVLCRHPPLPWRNALNRQLARIVVY